MNFAAFKTAVTTGLQIVGKMPMGGLIKLGVMAGVTVFTAWVLIKRAKKMHKNSNQEERNEATSPVDEILHGRDYVNNVDDFDDMDPAARELCRKLNKMRKNKKRKSKKKTGPKVEHSERVVSLFGDDFADDEKEKRGGERKQRKEPPPRYRNAAEMSYYEFGAGKKKKKKFKGSNDLRQAIKDVARSLDPTDEDSTVAHLFRGVKDEVEHFIETGGAPTEEEELREANPSLF